MHGLILYLSQSLKAVKSHNNNITHNIVGYISWWVDRRDWFVVGLISSKIDWLMFVAVLQHWELHVPEAVWDSWKLAGLAGPTVVRNRGFYWTTAEKQLRHKFCSDVDRNGRQCFFSIFDVLWVNAFFRKNQEFFWKKKKMAIDSEQRLQDGQFWQFFTFLLLNCPLTF